MIPFPAIRLPGHSGSLVRIEAAPDDFPGPDPTEDATRMNALFERRARHPSSGHFRFHRRFRTRQPGEPKPYD